MTTRNLGLFAIATFVPFVFITRSLFEKYGKHVNKKIYIPIMFFLPFFIIAVSLWVLLQLGKPALGTTHKFENAVDFFINSKLRGPIFNNYNIGSYLAYRLYPKEKVFIDSRPEAYPSSFYKEIYSLVFKELTDFQKADKKYNFNTIIYGFDNGMPQDAGFIKYQMQGKDWKTVYLDDQTIIFVKNVKRNESIIKTYAMSDTNFRLPKNA